MPFENRKKIVQWITIINDDRKWNVQEAYMAFDFKKAYKEIYMPKNEPELITVPKTNYISVKGKGDPNTEGGEYQQAIDILYAVAYTLKMSYKTGYKMEGFFEYVVPPLEGFWWQDGVNGVDYGNKDSFNWISVIMMHFGPFDDELQTIAVMDAYLKENGYVKSRVSRL